MERAREAVVTLGLLGLLAACGPRGEHWGTGEPATPAPVAAPADEATPAPAPTLTQDPRCPGGMVHVDGGEFPCGARGEDIDFYADWPGTEHLPRSPGTCATDAFCIDRYEYPNVAGELPRAYVSWDDAVRLCLEAGRRLCTEDEWTRACAGPGGQRFPYGDRHVEGICNADVNDKVGDPGWIRPSGSFADCRSAEDAFDLEGNLSEWVDAVSEELPEQRFVRGGTMWVGVYGRGCFARHRHHRADASHEDDGFRCCAAPTSPSPQAADEAPAEPATQATP